MLPNVLLVSEDCDFRTRLIQALDNFGYQVLPVRSAHSALIVLRQFPGPLQLLVTSEALAGMSGTQLGRVAAREREDLAVVIMKGTVEQTLLEIEAALRSPAHPAPSSGTYRSAG